MTQLIEKPKSPHVVPSSGGERTLAEWQEQKVKLTDTLHTITAELTALETELDMGKVQYGGNGSYDPVRFDLDLTDEEFFLLCENDPLLAEFGGFSKKPEKSQLTEPTGKEPGGVLSFISKRPVLSWLNTKLGVLLPSGVFGLLALLCLFGVVASLPNRQEARVEPTVLPVNLTVPSPTVGIEATVTAQAAQLTAIALRPANTPLPPTMAATTVALPSPTPTIAEISLARDGKLAPSSIQIPAIGWSKNNLVRFMAGGSNPDAVIDEPESGTLYHYGSFPGERPGNVVLIGNYADIAAVTEKAQVNDEISLTDRKGGVYTYVVLRWSDFNPKPLATPNTGVSGVGATATALANRGFTPPDIVTNNKDYALLAVPEGNRSYLTLISLPKREPNPNWQDNGERRAIRALLVSYKPAQPGLQGTPVSVPTNSFTPAPTPR
jgi:hypothetical protein